MPMRIRVRVKHFCESWLTAGVGVGVGMIVVVMVGVGSDDVTHNQVNSDSANCILSGVVINIFSNRFISPMVTNLDLPHSASATTGLILGGSSQAAGIEGEPQSRLPPEAR